jgi:hypothetical protein
MNKYQVLNKYPTAMAKHKVIKNLILSAIIILLGLLMYTQFYSIEISAFSNAIRISLFFIFAAFAFYNLNDASREVNLVIEEILIDQKTIQYSNLYGFDIVDLGDYIEIIFLTTTLTGQFVYVYLPTSSTEIPKLTSDLVTNVQFVENLNTKDSIHRILRYLNIR